jgi:syntaxin 16
MYNNKLMDKNRGNLEVTDQELSHRTKMIQERHQEINDIHDKISCINDIYKELGNLVVQQGEEIDIIEQNTEKTYINTKKGLDEIKKAEKKQVRCLIQ